MNSRSKFVILLFIGLVGLAHWPVGVGVTSAQTTDIASEKRLERDKNVPKEKIVLAYAEAKTIHDAIVRSVGQRKPEFKLYRDSASHLISSVPGRLGSTLDEITWRTATTELSMQIHLGLTRNEQLTWFRGMPNRIPAGDFFVVKALGDEAVLVKNTSFNQMDTSIGIHFVKGRAKVDMYLTNYKRKTERNEKELMEIARLIEPLIIARPNFDD